MAGGSVRLSRGGRLEGLVGVGHPPGDRTGDAEPLRRTQDSIDGAPQLSSFDGRFDDSGHARVDADLDVEDGGLVTVGRDRHPGTVCAVSGPAHRPVQPRPNSIDPSIPRPNYALRKT